MAVAYKDYYKVLGVEKTADAKAIKQAYRRLARKFHPDLNPGKRAAVERFKEITEAYEVLSDSEKRARYDAMGPDWQRYAQGFPGAGAGRGSQDFGGYRVHVGDAGDLGDFSEFFRTFFGEQERRGGPFTAGRDVDEHPGGRPSGRGVRWAQRGVDVGTRVEITLEEAASGTRRVVELERSEPCSACRGTGRHGQATCTSCLGQGEVSHPQRVEVKIPAGVRDGSRVRAAGEGGTGAGGGERGDLFLEVGVQPHPVFERRGDDLYVDLPIAAWEAALGAEIEVPTLRGKVTMRIPPETSSGKTFRLPSYGVPRVRGGGRGDQYVRVKIVIPAGLDPRERKLFEELRQLRPAPPR